MDERWFLFDELSPEDALRILAKNSVPLGKEDSKQAIEDLRIKIQRGAFGSQVTLLYPDPNFQKGRVSNMKPQGEF